MATGRRRVSGRTTVGLLVVVSAVLLPPASAAADFCPEPEAVYENTRGGAPAPSAALAVRMVGETVDFTELPHDLSDYQRREPQEAGWKVEAHYVFQNTVDREIRTTMIFPWDVPMRPDEYERLPLTPEQQAEEAAMRAEGGEGEVCATLRWTQEGKDIERKEIESYGVVVRVDGTERATELKQDVTCGKDLDYLFGHTFPMAFAPRATVNIDIEYEVRAGPGGWTSRLGCVTHGVGFVLRTGAPWKGPIGEIVMRYHFAYPTSMLDFRSRLEPLLGHSTDDMKTQPFRSAIAFFFAHSPLQADLVCENNVSTLTLTGHDVEPRSDLVVIVNSQYQRSEVLRWQGCPLDATTRRPTRDCCAEVNGPLVEPTLSEMAERGARSGMDEEHHRKWIAANFLCLAPHYAGDEAPVRPPPEAETDGGADASADAGDEDDAGSPEVRGADAEPASTEGGAGLPAEPYPEDETVLASFLDPDAPADGGSSAATGDVGASSQAPPPQQKKGCGCAVPSSPASGFAFLALALGAGLVRRFR